MMKPGDGYEIVVKRKRYKYLPKKFLKTEKIRVSDKYTFNATLWVANTPESNLRPSVNLKLQHSTDGIRFCFHDTVELISAIEALRRFAGGLAVTLHNSHTAAINEWISFHEEDKLPIINDYTVYTVIQEKSKDGERENGVICDTRTGEILEEISSDEEENREGKE